jgi:acyl-CoA synthetase (AMP-forming)/AMP-acid ligase II
MTLYEQFLTNSSKNIGNMALRYLGKETSYNDVRTAVARLSYLYQNEVGPHARVALIARNSPAFLKTFFALTNIRATIIPLNPEGPPSDWADAFKELQPTHVAITSDLLQTVREFLSHERLVLPIIEIEKKQGGEYDTSFTPPPENKPLDTDVILLTRSGGTLAKPKFVSLNHKQLQHAALSIRGCYKPMPTDRILTSLTWAHPFALMHSMLFPLMNGMTVVIDHGLQAVEFLDFLVDSRVNRLVGTPAFYLKLLITCRNEKRPPVGIKSATVGLGQLSHELKRAFQVLKIPAPHVYGQVENVWTIAMEAIDKVNVEPGVFGKALAGTKYKVMDEQGDEILEKGHRVGMLAISGAGVMTGYHGKEHEKDTKSALRGTWLYTGDYAALSGESDEIQLEYIGRKDDVMKSEGKVRSLATMEAVLRKIPGLSDAAAFVAKNSRNQLVPMAALVKIQGSPLSEQQAMDFCEANVTDGLCPKAIVFTDSIPRDFGGNVNQHKLRGQFSNLAG